MTAGGPASCDEPIGPGDDSATCQGACGGIADSGTCYCDSLCELYGDCRDDCRAD